MSDKKIKVMPGQAPDGRVFIMPVAVATAPAAAGFIHEQGGYERSPLADELGALPGVAGVKLDEREVIVVVSDPGDWDDIEPKVIGILTGAMTPSAMTLPDTGGAHETDGREVDSHIRIVRDGNDQAMRHYDCPKALVPRDRIASAGILHVPGEHGTSVFTDELNRNAFVRGVLVEGERVTVAVEDADRWTAAEHYIVEELERMLDGRFQAEMAQRKLCPSCRQDERYGFLGTASIRSRCTCERSNDPEKDAVRKSWIDIIPSTARPDMRRFCSAVPFITDGQDTPRAAGTLFVTGESLSSELADDIRRIEGVVGVEMHRNEMFVQVNDPKAWDDAQPRILVHLRRTLEPEEDEPDLIGLGIHDLGPFMVEVVANSDGYREFHVDTMGSLFGMQPDLVGSFGLGSRAQPRTSLGRVFDTLEGVRGALLFRRCVIVDLLPGESWRVVQPRVLRILSRYLGGETGTDVPVSVPEGNRWDGKTFPEDPAKDPAFRTAGIGNRPVGRRQPSGRAEERFFPKKLAENVMRMAVVRRHEKRSGHLLESDQRTTPALKTLEEADLDEETRTFLEEVREQMLKDEAAAKEPKGRTFFVGRSAVVTYGRSD